MAPPGVSSIVGGSAPATDRGSASYPPTFLPLVALIPGAKLAPCLQRGQSFRAVGVQAFAGGPGLEGQSLVHGCWHSKQEPSAILPGPQGSGQGNALCVPQPDPLLHDAFQLLEDARLGRTMAAAPDQGRRAAHEATILRTPFDDPQVVMRGRLLALFHFRLPSAARAAAMRCATSCSWYRFASSPGRPDSVTRTPEQCRKFRCDPLPLRSRNPARINSVTSSRILRGTQ